MPGAPLPVEPLKAGQWVAFGASEAGQLDKANGQKLAGFEIVAKCEKRDADLIKSLTRPWWKKVLPF